MIDPRYFKDSEKEMNPPSKSSFRADEQSAEVSGIIRSSVVDKNLCAVRNIQISHHEGPFLDRAAPRVREFEGCALRMLVVRVDAPRPVRIDTEGTVDK